MRGEREPRGIHLPAGFHYGPSTPEGDPTYIVDSRYTEAQKRQNNFPVAPEYNVVTGIEILGGPQMISHESPAACPRGTDLPPVTLLEDTDYYQSQIMPSQTSQLTADLPEGSRYISSPIESVAYATNVMEFTVLNVQYAYGIQPIRTTGEGVSIKDATAYRVRDGEIKLTEAEEDLSGLAYVAHLRVPVDLRDIFLSPVEAESFKGSLPQPVTSSKSRLVNIPSGKTFKIYNEHF